MVALAATSNNVIPTYKYNIYIGFNVLRRVLLQTVTIELHRCSIGVVCCVLLWSWCGSGRVVLTYGGGCGAVVRVMLQFHYSLPYLDPHL